MTRAHFQQFYVFPDNVKKYDFFLEGEEYKHAVKVLRKKLGDPLTATDGLGNLYSGKIQSIDKYKLIVNIAETHHNTGEPRLYLTIAQSVPKGNNFELVVEKGTEIGISAIQPIITERSVYSPDSKMTRWHNKAITAMKQCGRSRCPELFEPLDYFKALEKYKNVLLIIAHESYDPESSFPIDEKIKASDHVVLMIGPEGGFTEKEFTAAIQYGALPMNLGERRLRSETAALAGAVKILAIAGEL